MNWQKESKELKVAVKHFHRDGGRFLGSIVYSTEPNNQGKVHIGVACANPGGKDVITRKKGIEIALGRYKNAVKKCSISGSNKFNDDVTTSLEIACQVFLPEYGLVGLEELKEVVRIFKFLTMTDWKVLKKTNFEKYLG